MTFIKTPPTTPGFYAWRFKESDNRISAREIFEPVSGVMIDRASDWMARDVGGEWCRLVPAEQIVNAFTEGWIEAAKLPEHYDEAWKHSHAKQIAEGTL